MKHHLLLSLFCLLASYCLCQKLSDFTHRIPATLNQKLQVLKEADSIEVSVSLSVKKEGVIKQFRLVNTTAQASFYKGRLTKKELIVLLSQPEVVFINEYHQPKEELSTGAVDYTLNKINLARKAFPSVNGDSLFLSIKERSFDTTDIDLKGRVFSSGLSATTQTAHASLMATIVAGAGNSSPIAYGVAPSAYVSSADFANLFPEPDQFYVQKKISVQNHSYGTVVENFYGNEAVAYDRNVASNPSLVHVFSAGNAGTATPTSGAYTGIAGMANLTGNFKQSKNTISVAALDSSGQPMIAASKGPAFDGRVKPELVAYGEDGSSGAAALVSGTAALVQHAFQRSQGVMPNAALVKSILINSADDAGSAGIDYLTGYGSLNAYRAVLSVVENRFWQSTVSQGETKTLPLHVPPNASRIKLTLAWTDLAAQPNAAKALVNDIDLVLRNTTTGEWWEPWALNSKANKDSLLQLPQRKKDTLNNVEQITLDVPTNGMYQIEVRGSKLFSAQAFAVTYLVDTSATFGWTYPLNSDVLFPKQTTVLRWQTTLTGNADLEYSYNKADWKPIGNGINLSVQQHRWQTPDTIAVVFLRMNTGNRQFLTDSVVISPQLNLNIGFVCGDSFQLNWARLPVNQYRVYQLGAKNFEPLTTTSDTALVLRKSQLASRYFAVAPLLQGKEGWRSNSIPLDSSGAGCYFVSFYLQSQTASNASFVAQLGTLYNVRELKLQKLDRNGWRTVETIKNLSSTLFQLTDDQLLKGENVYRLQLILQNGTVLYSEQLRIYHNANTLVYLYPNPVTQGEKIKIISTEPGRFTVRFVNVMGVEVYRQFITNSLVQIPASRFSKGLYFVWINDSQGKPFVQKLLIQ